MIPENMVEINEFKGYFVTNDGRIFSSKKYKKLTEMVLREDKDGYYEIGLYKNNKRYFRRVHRLVAEAFIPNPDHLPQINHKDGNRKNNFVENLEWCTCLDNICHSFYVLHRKPTISTNKPIKLINKKNW